MLKISFSGVLPYCPKIEKLEVLSIANGEYLKQSKLKYLRINNGDLITTNLPHLNYLKTSLPFSELITTLGVDTIHFIICQIKKLHVTAHKAVTCCLVNMYVNDLSLVLPNCPKIITHDDDDRAIIDYDDDVFR
jgi:hypothetical protein